MNRNIAHAGIPAIGLGCMGFSHAYDAPQSIDEAREVFEKALELGLQHFDTASLYGAGANERLVGELLKSHRNEIFLASKCGLYIEDGKRWVDGSPEGIKSACEASLKALQTDVIDLYYLHRRDKNIPIEDSIGAFADLVQEGKIRSIGVSELSSELLVRAHEVAPIAAVQSEYSLASRQVEISVLETCKTIGAAFVSFSPFSRGILADMALDPSAMYEKDIRRNMPRFQEPNFSLNRDNLFVRFEEICREIGYTPAQVSLAWVLSKGDHIHTIPGTTSLAHLVEDYAAIDIQLEPSVVDELDRLINQNSISGGRYDESTQALVDTEDFD